MICIIPARAGSKRIYEKNLKVLDGVPIIGRTIRRAQGSGLFSEIFVSTESENISRISEDFGAQVLERPKELADDYSSTLDVMKHALGKVTPEKSILVCCLYPITPLLNFSRISEAIRKIETGLYDFVFPALPLHSQAFRAFECENEGRIKQFDSKNLKMRTQDLAGMYVDAGQFYLARTETWLNSESIISSQSCAVFLKPWEVLDVDTPQDWEVMESMYHLRNSSYIASSREGENND